MQSDAYMYQKTDPATPATLAFTNAPALNYRTEPVFYRYSNGAFPPGSPAGTAARLSNILVSPQLPHQPLEFADPQTPVLTAKAGTPVRFRWIYPAGPGSDSAGSSQVAAVHGHVFQEEPYINNSTELGFNPLSEWMGGRFILPGQSVDMLFSTWGYVRSAGRLLLRDVRRPGIHRKSGGQPFSSTLGHSAGSPPSNVISLPGGGPSPGDDSEGFGVIPIPHWLLETFP